MTPNQSFLRKIPITPFPEEHFSMTRLIDHVCLFKLEVNTLYPQLHIAGLLTAEEILKAHRFHQSADKQSYLVGRYMLRYLLAKFLQVLPRDISYTYTEKGKPQTDHIHFNISNTRTQVLIGLSNSAIGVDIEQVNPAFDFASVMDFSYSEEEKTFVSKSENPAIEFFTLWTRKEALLKATGEGLTEDLRNVQSLSKTVSREGKHFSIESYDTDHTHVLSVAINPLIRHLSLYELSAPTFF